MDSLCNCGTCQEALATAKKLMTQTLEAGNCYVWLMQVGTALTFLTESHMREAGVPPRALKFILTTMGDIEKADR